MLIDALDGDPGAVTKPRLDPLPTVVSQALVQDAIAFLRRTSIPIEPRKKWPTGGLSIYGLSGNIDADHRAQPGKALCVWGDAGWGGLVRQGKYQDGKFSDDLVAACADLFHKWKPQPRPTWVGCIPSLRHPQLVPDFASRLAKTLGLPFHRVLEPKNGS